MTPSNYPDNDLHTHVANGDVAKVKEALRKGANVNSKNEDNATPLVTAMCFAFLFYHKAESLQTFCKLSASC
jgi:hypothetical protein